MKTKELLDLIFKSPDVKYGLVEFEGIDFEKALSFSEEKGKYFLTCLKRNKPIQSSGRNNQTTLAIQTY